ncbi:uncharacterized protein [Pyrus communis]|uniref:uncharacterized protein n=1 Tax=Pyrus communis TaxID=23211 RepID=UPI0035BF3948
MAEFMGQFREQIKLPSSTFVNLNEGFETAKTITLRSGKEVGTTPQTSKSSQNEDEKLLLEEEEDAKTTTRFKQSKKEENEKDILETFRKVQVNITLLDAIKQVPKYAKFLKKALHNKEKDFEQGSSTDLGASINGLPYSIYASMNLGELKNDDVNHLIFPADFYVLDMEDSTHSAPLPILLGRPFMKSAYTKIDVFKGTLTVEFDGEIIDFNISEAIRNTLKAKMGMPLKQPLQEE